MTTVSVTRSVNIPDTVRIARYRRVPELGPRLLFFSGGSALGALSRHLIYYTHNSAHLITPFDSGGSSATLRRAFNMLAVGDLRNRLHAIADQSVKGNPQVYELFSYRFPKNGDNEKLKKKLYNMACGKDVLVTSVPNPLRRIIRNHLHAFLEVMPDTFDIRGANVGNLIITAGYLTNRRHIEPVLYMFERLVESRGTVRPVTGLSYHLAAELANGKVVAGQHNLTGENCIRLPSPVKKLFLTKTLRSKKPVTVPIKKKIRDVIMSADLICYAYGSFFTSLLASLLPHGIGQAVADTDCPKVYVPSTFTDPEQAGLTLEDSVKLLVDCLKGTCDSRTGVERLLQYVVIDSERVPGHDRRQIKKLETMGVRVIDTELVTRATKPRIDPESLSAVLLSMA